MTVKSKQPAEWETRITNDIHYWFSENLSTLIFSDYIWEILNQNRDYLVKTIISQIHSLLSRREQEVREITLKEVGEFQTKAIPETTLYAQGWNDGREYHKGELLKYLERILSDQAIEAVKGGRK